MRGFADAGCRYLQLDEVFIAMLCDPNYREQMKKRGDDPEKLGPLYADLVNVAMSGPFHPTRSVTMHLCPRQLQKSTFMGAGGYDAEAEVLFHRAHVHGYFMEYDSERAGGFEPLRLVPKGKGVVVQASSPPKDRQLDQGLANPSHRRGGRRRASIDQLALSPQCGFASTEEGNTLTEDEQWAKLRMIVEVADEVWGR